MYVRKWKRPQWDDASVIFGSDPGPLIFRLDFPDTLQIKAVCTPYAASGRRSGVLSEAQAALTGVSLDIENYCTLRLFFNLLDFGWSQATKLTGSRYPVAFPDIIACQIDVFPA